MKKTTNATTCSDNSTAISRPKVQHSLAKVYIDKLYNLLVILTPIAQLNRPVTSNLTPCNKIMCVIEG